MLAVLDDILQNEPLFAQAKNIEVEPIKGGFVNHNGRSVPPGFLGRHQRIVRQSRSP